MFMAITNWSVAEAVCFVIAVIVLGGVANSINGLLDDMATVAWRKLKGKDNGD